jgi:hypothetical protein
VREAIMNDATINTGEPVDINHHVRQLLAKQHSIAVIWCTDDVREIRPHLTEKQAWEVLQEIDDQQDAECGINWTTLETTTDDMFPKGSTNRRKP